MLSQLWRQSCKERCREPEKPSGPPWLINTLRSHYHPLRGGASDSSKRVDKSYRFLPGVRQCAGLTPSADALNNPTGYKHSGHRYGPANLIALLTGTVSQANLRVILTPDQRCSCTDCID